MIANDNKQVLTARAYAEVQAQLCLRGETSASAIFEATRAALGMREEDCSIEIFDAIFLAVRQGVVACNTFDPCANSIVFGSQTILTPTLQPLQ